MKMAGIYPTILIPLEIIEVPGVSVFTLIRQLCNLPLHTLIPVSGHITVH